MSHSDEHQQRLDRVLKYVETELSAGRDPKLILAALESKGAPRQEAIRLITQAINRRKSDSGPPIEQPSAVSKYSDNHEELARFVEEQLASGKSQQAIVDRLLARGVSREEAMDLALAAGREKRALTSGLSPGPVLASSRREPVDVNQWRGFVEQQLAENRIRKEIVEALVGEGVARADAIDLVLDIAGQPETPGVGTRRQSAKSPGGSRKLLIGAGVLVVGCTITGVSFVTAGIGDTYLVWYGPIVLGGIYIISGLIDLVRNR